MWRFGQTCNNTTVIDVIDCFTKGIKALKGHYTNKMNQRKTFFLPSPSVKSAGKSSVVGLDHCYGPVTNSCCCCTLLIIIFTLDLDVILGYPNKSN